MAYKLTHLSAVELARLVRTKKASPVEVVEAHLAAIQRINPAVNAFCTVAAEKALAWAREAERVVKKRAKLKPLHGVPVAIKDLTLTADIRTTFGSTLFRDHVRSEEHTSELQSQSNLVCRLLLEKKKPLRHPIISLRNHAHLGYVTIAGSP